MLCMSCIRYSWHSICSSYDLIWWWHGACLSFNLIDFFYHHLCTDKIVDLNCTSQQQLYASELGLTITSPRIYKQFLSWIPWDNFHAHMPPPEIRQVQSRKLWCYTISAYVFVAVHNAIACSFSHSYCTFFDGPSGERQHDRSWILMAPMSPQARSQPLRCCSRTLVTVCWTRTVTLTQPLRWRAAWTSPAPSCGNEQRKPGRWSRRRPRDGALAPAGLMIMNPASSTSVVSYCFLPSKRQLATLGRRRDKSQWWLIKY